MASSTRNHKIKRDIQGTILSRIATNALIPERYDALYYEILAGLNMPELPAHKQVAAILFAACTCNIVNKIDCRSVITEADFQEKLVQAQGLDDLYAQFFKLFDKLNASGTREQSKDEPQTNGAALLEALLSAKPEEHDNRRDINPD